MARTILQICQSAVVAKGITGPTGLFANDDYGNQLRALADTTARDIAMRGHWQNLITEYVFAATAVEAQLNLTATVPGYRAIINDTMWNRTAKERMNGPLSSQAWQRLKALTATPVPYYYRIRGDVLLFSSTAAAGQTIAFEYYDSRAVSNAAGTLFYENWQSDSDIFRMGDEMMVLGVRWRYLQAKGLEYGEEFRLYEDMISNRLGADTPSPILGLGGASVQEVGGPFISEGSWRFS